MFGGKLFKVDNVLAVEENRLATYAPAAKP
jgi:hypothetical protein